MRTQLPCATSGLGGRDPRVPARGLLTSYPRPLLGEAAFPWGDFLQLTPCPWHLLRVLSEDRGLEDRPGLSTGAAQDWTLLAQRGAKPCLLRLGPLPLLRHWC